MNILNVKSSGAESSDEVETENITFAPSVTPSVKEESSAPWQTVNEAIQEIPADYVVDQSCKFTFISAVSTSLSHVPFPLSSISGI